MTAKPLRQSRIFRGRSASPGIGIGAAFHCEVSAAASVRLRIPRTSIPAEIARLKKAYRAAIRELYEMETRKSDGSPTGLKDILAAHRMMLDDSIVRARVESRVRRELICAEWAVEEAYDEIAGVFSRMKNRHLAARRDDVRDVMRFLISHLDNPAQAKTGLAASPWPAVPFVAVAGEFSPSQTSSLLNSKVVGMVSHLGGRTSHSSILAREMGIPLVYGIAVKNLAAISAGDTLLVDGAEGRVTLRPSPKIVREFRKKISIRDRLHRDQTNLRAGPAQLVDGGEIFLRANIDLEQEIATAKKFGACGVGLFRTEYLYINPVLPDEETLYAAYRDVARKAAPFPVVVRTIDVGGDKFLSPLSVAPDLNPMLGMRAVRLCLAQPHLLAPQLNAAMRANMGGNVKLCLPLISSIEEIEGVRTHIEAARADLRRRRVPHRPVPLGIMVEVPSVAICIDRFLPHADFFSIGTNDLVQYTLAVSRTHEEVAHLYRPLHPSILSLLSRVVSVCSDAGKNVSLCGEEASNPLTVPFLLGIGLRDISMAPPSILDIKKLIQGLSLDECRGIARTMLELSTADEVEIYIRREVYPRVKRIIPLHYTYSSLESEL